MAAERARRRILDDAEIRAMWTASADLGTFGAILKVLLLTGQRRDKVVTMTWEDVERERDPYKEIADSEPDSCNKWCVLRLGVSPHAGVHENDRHR